MWGHSCQPVYHTWRGLFSAGFHTFISLTSLTQNNWWMQPLRRYRCGCWRSTELHSVLKGTNTFQKSFCVLSCLAHPLIPKSVLTKAKVRNLATPSFQVCRVKFQDGRGPWRREVWGHSGYKTTASELIRSDPVPESSNIIRSKRMALKISLILTKSKSSFLSSSTELMHFCVCLSLHVFPFSVFHDSSFLLAEEIALSKLYRASRVWERQV